MIVSPGSSTLAMAASMPACPAQELHSLEAQIWAAGCEVWQQPGPQAGRHTHLCHSRTAHREILSGTGSGDPPEARSMWGDTATFSAAYDASSSVGNGSPDLNLVHDGQEGGVQVAQQRQGLQQTGRRLSAGLAAEQGSPVASDSPFFPRKQAYLRGEDTGVRIGCRQGTQQTVSDARASSCH